MRLQTQSQTGEADSQNQAAQMNRPLGAAGAGGAKGKFAAKSLPKSGGRGLGAPAKFGSKPGRKPTLPKSGKGSGQAGPMKRLSERMNRKKADADAKSDKPDLASMKSEIDKLKIHLRLRGNFWSLGVYSWLCFLLLVPVLFHKLYWDKEIGDPIRKIARVNLGPAEKHPAVKLGKALARNIGLILNGEWALALMLFMVFGAVHMALVIMIIIIGHCTEVKNAVECAGMVL
jgi:hypothetical protein